MKIACATRNNRLKIDEMRLIFKGRILKDEMTIDDFKITDGSLINHFKIKKDMNPDSP